jgi:L,D-transpeptidase catalytic domain
MKKQLLLFLISWGSHVNVFSQPTVAAPKQALADFLLEYMTIRYPHLDVDGDVLYVSVRNQLMYHVRGRQMQREFVISTSQNGLGQRQNSFRTPTGLHYVRERIGGGLPPWSIFRERIYTGDVFDTTTAPDGDLITSRILWLSGMEAGLNEGGNVDSYARTIYIHGTADEASLGTPSSHGCIRMYNRDVIALFEEIPVGALVVIYDN